MGALQVSGIRWVIFLCLPLFNYVIEVQAVVVDNAQDTYEPTLQTQCSSKGDEEKDIVGRVADVVVDAGKFPMLFC
jgi:hypothetical protein